MENEILKDAGRTWRGDTRVSNHSVLEKKQEKSHAKSIAFRYTNLSFSSR